MPQKLYLSAEVGMNANFESYQNGFRRPLMDDVFASRYSDSPKDIRKELLSHTGYDVTLKFAAGYKIVPQFTVGGGVGANVSVNTSISTFSIPVFVRLRSDILQKKVTPFVELDLGYAFMIKSSISGETSVYRHTEDGAFNKNNGWIAPTSDGLMLYYKKGDEIFEKSIVNNDEDIKATMKECGLTESAIAFSSGNVNYTNVENYDTIRDGLFGELTFGVGFKMKKQGTFNLGVSCGLAQCFRGLIVHDSVGYAMMYGKMEYLNKVNVITVVNETTGEEDSFLQYARNRCFTFSSAVHDESFIQKFRPTLSLKVGFSF